MKKVIILIMLLITLGGCKKNTNELIMVTEAGFAPYEYYDGGEIVGVDVDIAREIAKYLGKQASCLLTVVDSYYKNLESTSEEREKSLNDMIVLALESI